MEIRLNENALKGGGGIEKEMFKTTLLIRFCQIYSNSLPKRALSSFKITNFEALGSEIFRFLYVGFYSVTTCWCLLFDLFCFHVKCSGFEGQINLTLPGPGFQKLAPLYPN